eukprot:2542966-Pleurochrysis_carterae.AAC.1
MECVGVMGWVRWDTWDDRVWCGNNTCDKTTGYGGLSECGALSGCRVSNMSRGERGEMVLLKLNGRAAVR